MANEEAIIFARVFRNGEVSGFIEDRRDVFGGIHWHLLAPSPSPECHGPPLPSLRLYRGVWIRGVSYSMTRKTCFNGFSRKLQQKRSTRFGVPFRSVPFRSVPFRSAKDNSAELYMWYRLLVRLISTSVFLFYQSVRSLRSCDPFFLLFFFFSSVFNRRRHDWFANAILRINRLEMVETIELFHYSILLARASAKFDLSVNIETKQKW